MRKARTYNTNEESTMEKRMKKKRNNNGKYFDSYSDRETVIPVCM